MKYAMNLSNMRMQAGLDDLAFELRKLARKVRAKSHATQTDRERMLAQCAADLRMLGYRKLTARGLKPKHVESLVNHWKEQDISSGRMKNLMTSMRWWAETVGKANVIPRSNDSLGIARRTQVAQSNGSTELNERLLAEIRNERLAVSLRLQAAFGLRREEALKIRPTLADCGDHVKLERSWCKGGRPRAIPIRTETQRAVLNDAKDVAGKGSMIPSNIQYREWVKIWEHETRRAGIGRTHGLRHGYAIKRYEEMTGRRASVNGGQTRKQMNRLERMEDDRIRLTLAEELGHGRIQIVAAYVGE